MARRPPLRSRKKNPHVVAVHAGIDADPGLGPKEKRAAHAQVRGNEHLIDPRTGDLWDNSKTPEMARYTKMHTNNVDGIFNDRRGRRE